MNIIKEYCQSQNDSSPPICVVRTRTYADTLHYFDELFAVAKSDFPGLRREDCVIVHYGGRHYKGTYGIEFRWSGEIPESYQKIEHLEYKL